MGVQFIKVLSGEGIPTINANGQPFDQVMRALQTYMPSLSARPDSLRVNPIFFKTLSMIQIGSAHPDDRVTDVRNNLKIVIDIMVLPREGVLFAGDIPVCYIKNLSVNVPEEKPNYPGKSPNVYVYEK